MVKYKLDALFTSLSDPTRRNILQRLTEKEMTVSEIAEDYHMSLPAVSKHLKVLESARLITKERHGRQQFVKLSPMALRNLSEHVFYYEMLLSSRLDALEDYLHAAPVSASPIPPAEEAPGQEPVELAITHIFDAPLERVWEAYTDPQQVSQWWAPKGAALVGCEIDVRVGGHWRFTIYDANGQEYVFSGIFRKVERLRRLVYTDGFGEPDEPRPESQVIITFESLPGNKTKMVKTSLATPATHQLQAALLKSMEREL